MKKIISIIVTLTMLLGLLAVVPFSASATWSGGSAAAFGGGSGTEADPYLISTPQQLALLAEHVNTEVSDYAGVYFKMTTDIDLAGIPWEPIGDYTANTKIFKGNFDGAGYIVSGLFIDNADAANVGLFGRTAGATIKNLTVKGDLVSGKQYAGAVVGYAMKSSNLLNCTSEVQLIVGTTVGGIAGRVSTLGDDKVFNNVIGCISYSNINTLSSKNVFAGGIVGAAGGVIINYCGNHGKVDIIEGGTSLGLAGGIVGVQGADSLTSHVRNCYNVGSISAVSTCDNTYAGGIAGRAAHVEDYEQLADVKCCFSISKDIVVKDASGAVLDGKSGSLIGNIHKVATVLNCYTSVPLTEMVDVGFDAFASVEAGGVTELTLEQMSGLDAVTTMKLGSAWVAGADTPTIDTVAALTAPNDVPDTEAWTQTEAPVTTEAPTTDAPADTTTEAAADTTTAEPEAEVTTAVPTTDAPTTNAPTTEAPKTDDGGCGGLVALGFAACMIPAAVVVLKKRD